ncbi:hypothetical protein D9615_009954 [Tricholomella constricta]|uniref:CENP-C homolog n=1 Tax=Tricholomella constricta TaxID=117010 RepID=A0A8H5GQG1_9AGAR|nr:hypothetical protein D9615_009954 [Tricholomella constricta]
MAETTTAGPSCAIPIITVSSESMDTQQDISSSRSTSSTSLTHTETPLPIKKSPPPAVQHPVEAADKANDHEVPVAEEPQRPVALPTPNPVKGDGTAPPRTQAGPPNSIKRTKQGKGGGRSSPPPPVDDQTPWHGTVLDYGLKKQELSKVVVFPSKMVYAPPNVPYRLNNNKPWTFQKSIRDSDFIGSGFVFIEVGGEKERKNVKDNGYVFIVLEGAVEVTIHRTSYAVSTGGVFLIPRGNDYSIRNITDKDAKLFFAQARKMRPDEEDESVPLNRPTSKTLMLADWLLQRITLRLIKLRAQAFAWYWNHLAKYQHYVSGRRLYLICFLFGLLVRRLPFIGSPPILNVQLIRLR